MFRQDIQISNEGKVVPKKKSQSKKLSNKNGKKKTKLGSISNMEHCYKILIKHPRWAARESKKNVSEDLVVYQNQVAEGSGTTSSSSSARVTPPRPQNGRKKLKDDKNNKRKADDSFKNNLNSFFLSSQQKAKKSKISKGKQAIRFFDLKVLAFDMSTITNPDEYEVLKVERKAACDRISTVHGFGVAVSEFKKKLRF